MQLPSAIFTSDMKGSWYTKCAESEKLEGISNS
jgi:hypothetical protein